jgi:hypothetical protein
LGIRAARIEPSVDAQGLPHRRAGHELSRRPLEFIQRLAVLVPRPRLYLIRFYGMLAPNAKLRTNPHDPADLRPR